MYRKIKNFVFVLFSMFLVGTATVTVYAAETKTQGSFQESAEWKEIQISNVEEFLEFAENCRLDSYSQNLSVVLEADIDFTGVDFRGIPIFCGKFNGDNHTISGLQITGEGSFQGLFRYVEKSAVICNLVVIGEVKPLGTRSMVGGIAGNNAGRIKDCNFYGSISGADYIGGLAGCNEMTGIIENCRVKADIQGNHFVGGFAGINYGVIRNCINMSDINTTVAQNAVEIADITIETLTGTESSATVTDIGGIAGYSSGVIRGCENKGTIGYQQIGYNIGGIAGGQNGYVTDCENYGKVFGRKEIGGIVGHMEPVLLVEYSLDTLQILQGQLEYMETLTEQAADDIKENVDEMDGQTGDLQEDIDNARTAVEALLDGKVEDGEYDEDSINAIKNNLSTSLSDMSGHMENITATSKESLAEMSDSLQAMANQMNAISSTLQNGTDNIGISFADVSDKDTPADIGSKIEDCSNYGSICADRNVGGIVGAIALERDLDKEDEIQVEGENSLNVSSELRAVILACENRGKVTARKQNSGGIIGRMDMGLARECLNVGSVEGTDYVGGIAGQSRGYIRTCDVQCSLSGDKCVGGVAGVGTILSDCRTMVRLENGSEKLGTVLGMREEQDTEEENPICGNYYLVIDKDYGAIDGVSYSGKAEPLSSDDFFALEDLEKTFGTVEISFCQADESVVKTVRLKWGEKLTEDKIPAIPEKQGYVGYWDGLEERFSEKVLFHEQITVGYVPKNAAIQSAEVGEDNRPILLIQGEFVPQQKVVVEQLHDMPQWEEGRKTMEAWTFSVAPSGTASKLRYLMTQEETEHLQIQVRNREGNWRKVPWTLDGSYLVFAVTEGDDAFCLVQEEVENPVMLWLIAGGVVLLLTGFIGYQQGKKRKCKKYAATG